MCAMDVDTTHGGASLSKKLLMPSCALPIIITPTADNIDSIVPQQAAQLTINNRPSAFMWHDAESHYKMPRDSNHAGFGIIY